MAGWPSFDRTDGSADGKSSTDQHPPGRGVWSSIKSVWVKFLLFLVPTVTLATVLLTAVISYVSYQDARTRLVEDVETIARVNALALGDPLWRLNEYAIDQILGTFSAHPEVACATLSDSWFDRVWPEGGCPAGVDPQMSVSREIFDHGEAIGTLTIFYTTEPVVSDILGQIWFTFAVFTLLVGLAVLAAVIGNRFAIGAPIKQLLAAIEQTRSGRLSRVTWQSQDELGQVIAAYNEMVAQIESRTNEIEAARREAETLNADLTSEIAERQRAELALLEAKEMADAANRSKSEFLAMMSHELRTPLNAILGFSEIIKNRTLGQSALDKYVEYAGDVHASGRHLLDLINDILDLSKIEAGKLEIEPAWLDLAQVLRTTTTLVRVRAESHGLSLGLEIPGEPPPLYADERAIKQIVFNLLSNAIKFTKPGGRISVSVATANPDFVDIVVSDTGIGIPADQIEKVTRPFEQVNNSFSRDVEGTGLGLSLVKGLAELHGGDMAIESTVDVGTTVTVRFRRTPDNRLGLTGNA